MTLSKIEIPEKQENNDDPCTYHMSEHSWSVKPKMVFIVFDKIYSQMMTSQLQL